MGRSQDPSSCILGPWSFCINNLLENSYPQIRTELKCKSPDETAHFKTHVLVILVLAKINILFQDVSSRHSLWVNVMMSDKTMWVSHNNNNNTEHVMTRSASLSAIHHSQGSSSYNITVQANQIFNSWVESRVNTLLLCPCESFIVSQAGLGKDPRWQIPIRTIIIITHTQQ